MKLFLISDIHGSAYYLEKALESFHREKADYILILGDELYHGPRNPLPEGHDPKKTVNLLNAYADKIIAVRGNCDAEVDEMLLEYPIMATYSIIFCEGRRLFLTHGHIYNDDNMPRLSNGDVFIYGHTHIPRAEKKGGLYFINPGSISMPKENNPNSYGTIENNRFHLKNLTGDVISELQFQ